MGEDWWSQGSGLQEIEVSNVKLDISDAAFAATPNPPADSTLSTIQPPSSTPNINPTPTSTHTATDTPNVITPSSSSLSTAENPQPTGIQETKQDSSLWIVLPIAVTVAVGLEILFMVKKR
jgi:hypothetical protein